MGPNEEVDDEELDEVDEVLPEGHVCGKRAGEREFERMCELMGLNVKAMGDEEERDLAQLKGRLVQAICEGRLTVDEKGQPTYTPRYGGEPVTFKMYTGASLMSMDGKPRKKSWEVTNMIDVMCDMSGVPRVRYQKMDGRDLKVCMAIGNLFLAG